MGEIRIRTWESSGLDPVFASHCSRIEAGVTLGKGGFGEVLACLALDGQATQDRLAVKTLGEVGDPIAMHGYETVGELIQRILSADAARRRKGEPPLASVPGLFGLPLYRFEGERNGRRIYGYVMNRLDTRGFVGLDAMIENENPAVRKEYMRAPIADRLAIALSFAEAMHVLIEELGYLHCDINDPNLWCSVAERRCVLIDFDGGMLLNSNRRATTPGKDGDWMAPEILEEKTRPNGDPLALVSPRSEYWPLLIGISTLCFSRTHSSS